MKITPVKGTNDYLPQQVRVRDYLQNKILETYRAAGFERITTPIIEDIENLDKSDGGENLALIFKIMKRGDKLNKAIAEGGELSDMGLRYDLTLPLTRYYANNRAKLMNPFKVIQTDRVYRAERPQKGRLREFIQCDIDIIGTESRTAELELILTTAKALKNVGLDNFKVKINDRRLLRALLMGLGFSEDSLDSVCIVFDKLDKIGPDGIAAEMTEKGFPAEAIAALSALLSEGASLDAIKQRVESEAAADLEFIINSVNEIGGVDIEFDMSLVRGQGYYTGTVFEVVSNDFRGAIAGGGRYDNLIGKFIGEDVPAVGFSIGFERIAGILEEKGISAASSRQRLAVVYGEGDFIRAQAYAEEKRAEYDTALFERPKKLNKLINRLEEQGYDAFYVIGWEETEPKVIDHE
ncbi:MAG: histidine--tRNA ligase [Oscillospiraceae bacterium]|nr:histidine--tRNA ligase [Oscillospiraceae bacterium]